MTATARLVTIRFSHFCEKARWALEWAEVPYEEDFHLPGFSLLAAWRAGGTRTTPVLVLPEGQVLADSADIVRYADEQAHSQRRLFPQEALQRAECERWIELFDASLGPATRRFAYGHLLPERTAMMPYMRAQARKGERWMTGAGYPLLRGLIQRALRIDPASVERSRTKIEQVLAQVDEALSDGRAYLVGERFSAADLTFAALVAPAVFPEHQCSRLPALDELPTQLRRACDAWRARPSGALALELWRKHRQPRTATHAGVS